ncbi:MAG: NYN domain-containing protein [Candidatus Dojkabacteria bacterium]|jgi:uncharacterized LabA/DUF88 family protein
MNNTIVLIDDENFIYKMEKVLRTENIKINIQDIKLRDLISRAIKSNVDINFYAARLRFYSSTPRKSKQLIDTQRRLRNTLKKQEINFIYSGYVRARRERGRTVFKEKGVDVKIAVDMVSMACDKRYETIVLCSSDSDLQPAVTEAKSRDVRVVYLGFSMEPNRGLIYTTDRTVLFDNDEILSVVR